MTVRATVDGLVETIAAVDLLGKGYDVVVVKAQADLAAEVVEKATPNVRVRTGAMKKDLRVSSKGPASEAVAGEHVPYTAPVHWRFGPQFLTDAAAVVDERAVDRQQDMVDDLIEQVIGR